MSNKLQTVRKIIDFLWKLLPQVWAADDYEIFKRMMIQKNIELQLQALELIQQKWVLQFLDLKTFFYIGLLTFYRNPSKCEFYRNCNFIEVLLSDIFISTLPSQNLEAFLQGQEMFLKIQKVIKFIINKMSLIELCHH